MEPNSIDTHTFSIRPSVARGPDSSEDVLLFLGFEWQGMCIFQEQSEARGLGTETIVCRALKYIFYSL